MLDLLLCIGNICNGLLLGNATLARVLKTLQALGFKEIMVYQIAPGGR